MKYLLDTNVICEPAKPSPDPAVVRWLQEHSSLDYAVSVLVLGEIAKGVASLSKGRRRTTLEEWVSEALPKQFSGRILSVDLSVALEWGRLSAVGRNQGRALPVIDGLLLATAATRGLTLITRNEADCTGRGVPVLNPWTPPLGD